MFPKQRQNKNHDKKYVFVKIIERFYPLQVCGLELCGSVLATELAELILDEFNIKPDAVKFYMDIKVVLGYIHNQTRIFYIYISNRVEHIRKSTHPEQ